MPGRQVLARPASELEAEQIFPRLKLAAINSPNSKFLGNDSEFRNEFRTIPTLTLVRATQYENF